MTNQRVNDTIAVLTLNWQRANDTIECLKSIQSQDIEIDEIVVVDNGSSDGSVELIQNTFPDITLLSLKENLGFAGGFNFGINFLLSKKYKYLLMVNNDTVCSPSMVRELYEASKERDAITAPFIYYYDSPDRVWSAGGDVSKYLLEILKHERNIPKDKPIQRDFLTGCALFASIEQLSKIGLFNEDFFLYYEDRDFCMRANALKIPLYVVPQASLWHKVSASSDGSDSINERYWMGRSSVIFYKKYAKGLQVPLVFLWRFGSSLRTSFRLLKMEKSGAFKAYLRGLLDGLRN